MTDFNNTTFEAIIKNNTDCRFTMNPDETINIYFPSGIIVENVDIYEVVNSDNIYSFHPESPFIINDVEICFFVTVKDNEWYFACKLPDGSRRILSIREVMKYPNVLPRYEAISR